MTLVCLILASILSWAFIVRPSLRANAKRDRDNFRREFRRFQLKTVQQYFPEMEGLSLREIEENYNFRAAYESLSVGEE